MLYFYFNLVWKLMYAVLFSGYIHTKPREQNLFFMSVRSIFTSKLCYHHCKYTKLASVITTGLLYFCYKIFIILDELIIIHIQFWQVHSLALGFLTRHLFLLEELFFEEFFVYIVVYERISYPATWNDCFSPLNSRMCFYFSILFE